MTAALDDIGERLDQLDADLAQLDAELAQLRADCQPSLVSHGGIDAAT